METTKTKKRKSKKVNQVELYKRYFIFNEFEKNIEERLIYDLDEELYEYIMSVIDINTIADFSDYGYDVFDLDYIDYVSGNKCFLCFVKFDLDEFVECMIEDYID